jgi:hypothetical protein
MWLERFDAEALPNTQCARRSFIAVCTRAHLEHMTDSRAGIKPPTSAVERA